MQGALCSATWPNFEVLVYTAGNDSLLFDGYGRDKVAVDIDHLPRASTTLQVPGSKTFIVAYRKQKTAIRVEHDIRHPVIVAYQSDDALPTSDLP